MALVVIEADDEQAVPGDLNAHVQDDKLMLPREVVDAVRKDGVRTAEDLLSYMTTFPSSVAYQLHWSLGDVSNAAAKLRAELEGHIPNNRLHPQLRPNPPLGARDPDELW
jgi:hypothetical protein